MHDGLTMSAQVALNLLRGTIGVAGYESDTANLKMRQKALTLRIDNIDADIAAERECATPGCFVSFCSLRGAVQALALAASVTARRITYVVPSASSKQC